MIPRQIPTNSYTNHPIQHSNFFLGSLQLFSWLVFRPTAWENHVKYLIQLLDQGSPRQWKLFVSQIFLWPIFCSVVFGGLALIFNTPFSRVVVVVLGEVTGSILGSAYGYQREGIRGGVAFILVLHVLAKIIVDIEFNLVVFGVSASMAFCIVFSVLFSVSTDTPVSIAFGMWAGLLIGIAFGIKVDPLVIVAFGIWGGTIGIVVGSVAVWVNFLRATIMAILLVPWHALLYYIDAQKIKPFSSNGLSNHLAFWDEWQYFPIWGLDKHLLLVLENNPTEGRAALSYLSTSRQRWAAQTAQIELNTRQIEKCSDVLAVGQIQQILAISELGSPANNMFRRFNSISFDVDVALRQFSIYNQRLALTDVVNRLNSLIRELTTSSDKYAVRFRPIAQRWQNIIDLHLQELLKESELRQEIDSPYIIGVPVTNRQQLFVGRISTSEKLEKLLLDRRSPPLLLYGQRRTGKTSLLNNLGRLLPTSIIPLFVDLQGSISSAKDHTGFLYNLAKAMINSAQRQRNLKLPPLSYETLATDPFTRFDEWLDNLETALAGNTALLALDEFEVLDRVLNEGRFNENDVLGMLRNLIQHRPTFKVLLAGSHTLDEFQRWSSYLINAQVIHLGYLQEAEARQLIETPIENFALRYQPSASQRVLDITKGHPFLVQLLCAEIVALKNDQDPSIRRLATLADVEAAIPAALEHGSMFFSDIERNQLETQSLQVLRYFAQQGEAATISKSELEQRFSAGLEGAIELLLRREIIETKPSGYSIQLELIRRWFL
jgi:hypothetical protein